MFLFDLGVGSYVLLNMFDPIVPGYQEVFSSTMMCFNDSGSKASNFWTQLWPKELRSETTRLFWCLSMGTSKQCTCVLVPFFFSGDVCNLQVGCHKQKGHHLQVEESTGVECSI